MPPRHRLVTAGASLVAARAHLATASSPPQTRVLEFDETFEASWGEEQCTELLKQGYTQLD